jgi:hypothetical protein
MECVSRTIMAMVPPIESLDNEVAGQKLHEPMAGESRAR